MKDLTESLWRAIHHCDEPRARELLLAGANPSARGPLGWTALHYAAHEGLSAVTSLLLQFHADVSARTSEKRTPLHLACLSGHFEVAQILVAVNAQDVNARDCDGCTALHFAHLRKNPALVDLLLQHGASPWIANTEGETPDRARGGLQVPKASPTRTLSAPSVVAPTGDAEIVSPTARTQPVSITDFAPLGFLGQGEFGKVYLVEHRRTHRLFAMKVIAKRDKDGRDLMRYIETERNVLARLDHPFIVRLHWAFQTESHLYLVVDYCPGGDLNELIQREGRLEEEIAKLLVCEVALAVEELHTKNVIYRDLKPENIVLDAEGHVRLTDFGLAKVGMTKLARTGSFCAPLSYSPPEMLRRQTHGQAADWYMFGCLLYEMLVGTPPFRSHEQWKLLRKIETHALKLPQFVSPEAADLILRLLDSDPERRLCGLEALKAHQFFDGVEWTPASLKQAAVLRASLKTPQSLHGHRICDCAADTPDTHLAGWNFCRE